MLGYILENVGSDDFSGQSYKCSTTVSYHSKTSWLEYCLLPVQ